MRKLLLITAFMIAAPALAHAGGYYDSYGTWHEDEPEKGWKGVSLEGSFGILAGSAPVGYVDASIAAPHLDVGARKDRWLVYASGAMGSIGESDYMLENPVNGIIGRVGLGVRYTYGRLGGGRGEIPLRGQFWVQVGAGHQHIQWNEGGVLGRQDLVIGLGAQLDVRVSKAKLRYMGLYYALDIMFTGAPATKERPPVCAGPCDEATGPGSMDVGFVLNVGIPFGK